MRDRLGSWILRALACAAVCSVALVLSGPTVADETCQSPFLPKIAGQEDFIYVWTLGIEGLGDGSDKLVTVGANPDRPGYGKVVHSLSLGGRHEAHHGGLSDDRRYYWLGGLDDSKIFIVDIGTDPAEPRLVRTIDDFPEATGGVVGPHGFYALPGRMLISALSNEEGTGRTALVEYSNEGEYIRTIWMPEGAEYGYDARVNVDLNRMLTSSFTGKNNYMRPLGELIQDSEAMKNFGNTVVVWDFHARKPLQILEIPGAPLEIRWALGPRHHYAFTTAALTSKLWGIFREPDGSFEAVELADIGDPSKVPLPVDISLSSDDRLLFVSTFLDGTVRVFNVENPRSPTMVYEKKLGQQTNMISQSWDGDRIYVTSSLLSKWDYPDPALDGQYLKAFDWNGQELVPRFEIDFRAEGLGRPHLMRFGQFGLYATPGGGSAE